MLVGGMLMIAAALLAFVIAAWLLRAAVYLVIGAGYVLYGVVVAAGAVLFAVGWLVWKVARGTGWLCARYVPAIADRFSRPEKAVNAAPATAQRRPPVKEIGVVHWGYGQLSPARTKARELMAGTSSVATRR